MKEILSKLTRGQNLSAGEAEEAIKTIMSGKSNDIEIAAMLTALKMKGETAEEIAAFAKIMRQFAVKIDPKVSGTLVDMCGTGGDNSGTFNVSSSAMFVVAAAGIPVAKHGNRAMTSKCGSADVLEALGVDLSLPAEKIEDCIETIGIGFMFAPMHHAATKHVISVRKALGFRTVFNILGPMTNPANAKAQVMGVYDPELTGKLAEVFSILGLTRAMVVHGEPGLDELSTIGKTRVSELKEGRVNTYYISPDDFGIKAAKVSDLAGGTPKENAETLTKILSGEETGPKKDIVLLNAAAGIVVGGKADDLKTGVEIAQDLVDSGRAKEKLDQYLGYFKKCSTTKG